MVAMDVCVHSYRTPGRSSSVSIVTKLLAGRSGFESRQGQGQGQGQGQEGILLFAATARPAWGTPSLPFDGYRGLFPIQYRS
jgi:hypothetical protein